MWRLSEEKGKKSTMEYAEAREEEVNTTYHAFKKARRRAKKNGDSSGATSLLVFWQICWRSAALIRLMAS
jgi:hypothetical protein